MLNRRETLKAGALGALFGFLFRGRGGELAPEPIAPDQKPSAAVITCMPQRAFRPERLVIAGTVIGRELAKVRRWQDCSVCGNKYDPDREYSDDPMCAACDDAGGAFVETGELEERDVVVVPWTIEDITIGTRTQLAASGSIPGDVFAMTAPDAFVSLDSVGANQEISFRVRYTGDKPEGEVFRASLIGCTVGEDGSMRMAALPICSNVEIVA